MASSLETLLAVKVATAGVPPAAVALGQAIRRFRRERGWSIAELGARAGVSYQYLSEIETGKCNFSIQVLEKVAFGLGVPFPALFKTAYPRAPNVSLSRAA